MLKFCAEGKLESTLLDFDQALAQADIKLDALIEILEGYDNPNGNCFLKLKKNIHGLFDRNLT